MRKLFAVTFVCGITGCMSEEAVHLDEAVAEADTEEQVDSEPEKANLAEIDQAFAPCGKVGPNLENYRANDAAYPNTANQRTGSSTSCAALGALQPTDDAIFFCYTTTSSYTWTYLQNVRTGVRGWVRNDLLRPIGGIRGSVEYCGF